MIYPQCQWMIVSIHSELQSQEFALSKNPSANFAAGSEVRFRWDQSTAGLCCFNMDPSLGHRSTLHFKPAHPMIHPQITHHQTLLPFTLWPDHHLECPRMQRRPRIFQDSFAASVRFLASLALGVDDLGVDYFPVLLPSLAPCGTACGKERQKGIHSAGISLCPCPRTVPGGGGGGGSTTGWYVPVVPPVDEYWGW